MFFKQITAKDDHYCLEHLFKKGHPTPTSRERGRSISPICYIICFGMIRFGGLAEINSSDSDLLSVSENRLKHGNGPTKKKGKPKRKKKTL